MPQQRLYHEYIDSKLIPYWYVLTFESGEINWDKPVMYYDVIAPFEFIERDGFDESVISFSIYFSDFIINRDKPNQLGLNLRSILKRIERYGIDPYVIKQLIVQIPDINDVISLLPNTLKMEMVIQ